MRRVKLLFFSALALMAFGTVGTTVASAADEGTPQVLCLVAGCQNLEGTLKGGASELVTLSGKVISGETVEGTLKNCEAVAGTGEKDILLCKDVPIDFTGVKSGGANCKTEGDAVGVVLVLLDLHMADEKSTGGVLQPLLLFHILNSKLELLEVVITCGVLKVLVKGTIGCLALPGLVNIPTTQEVEVLCKLLKKEKEGKKEIDPETGTCEVLCELLEKNPFLANLGGGYEDAWMSIHAKGKLNKDIFIDD
jgi:hypothetical protein